MSTNYEDARIAYWNASDAFREVAVAEIRGLIPDGYVAAVLELNDTPRLTVQAFRDAEGNDTEAEEFDVFDGIDQIAWDTGWSEWHDVKDALLRDPQAEFDRFIITKED